jgi:MYXO-CTERM domain-containing protein
MAGVAGATPPEPKGPHPRMLLDKTLERDLRTYGKLPVGPVAGAIKLCDEARTTDEHKRALYQGAEWAKVLQACLVAWAATDDKNHANTAIKYFTALIDDLDTLGDGKGGDEAARRDHGYAIRNLGPYTALAYDWLHKQMPDPLKARARQRWKAWLDWYKDNGYRARVAGSNYQAGYLLAATTIAIAEAGEAGADGTQLWALVADELWGKDMAHALTTDGVLAGGDWPEGWQYGPLSVAEYALGARIMKGVGVEIQGIQPWLSSILRRHVYALAPSEKTYAGGDTEFEEPNLEPHVLTLAAVALGDSSPQDRTWARGELARLRLTDKDYLLYSSLASIGDGKPDAPARDAWPTWYVSANTGTLYARTRWDDTAVWFVTECHATIETDHRHPSAGTFSLSRGKDDVIVDPTPYGSQSTLTSNAPTVDSPQLPKDYLPSQGSWSEKTGYDFITQRASGIVAARCDYSDQYKFQDKASDVPSALRDWVLVPSQDGRDAALLVVDRADTTSSDRGMDLRFRTPGKLDLADKSATASVGSTKLSIAQVTATGGTVALGAARQKDCYKFTGPKGQCDAARFPVTDYRARIPGPRPVAVHLISAAGKTAATAQPLTGKDWAGASIKGVRDAVVVWRTSGSGAFSYTAPANAMHVVLDAPEGGQLTATAAGGNCSVKVDGAGPPGKPLVAMLDAQCKVTVDPEAAAASAVGTRAQRGSSPSTGGGSPRSPRSGCCGAEAAPGQSFAMALVVVGILARRRRRRASI